MVAEETKTLSLGMVSAAPPLPNSTVSVWAALTTTQTTISAFLAASAGVFAPAPPSFTKRATASAVTSQPVTAKPARFSEVAMPKPIEPSPMTAMRFSCEVGMRLIPETFPDGRSCWTARRTEYHGLAALPKRETTGQHRHAFHEQRNTASRGYLPLRTLAVRARADAGLFRQYQRQAG